jgi:hypothetical protein
VCSYLQLTFCFFLLSSAVCRACRQAQSSCQPRMQPG